MPKTLTPLDIAAFRDRLCDAAAGLFAERGHADFTLREVAQALGVSPMTPYRYFKDKDAMLAAMRSRAFDRFAETLEAVARDRPETGHAARDAIAYAEAAGDAYIRFALGDPVSYKLMFDVRQPADTKHPELAAAAERARRTMTSHIHPLVGAGLVEGDPILIGHVYWAVLHGAVMLHLADKLAPDCDLDRILPDAFAALATGFAPRATG